MEQECTNIEPLLCFYITDELSPTDRHKVENHLVKCSECKLSIEKLEKTSLLLKESFDPKVPSEVNLDGLWEEIESQVKWASSGPGYFGKIKKILGEPALWVPVFAATTAAVIIFMQIQDDQSLSPQFTKVEPEKSNIISQEAGPSKQVAYLSPESSQDISQLNRPSQKVQISTVESVYSSTGRVMVLQTAASGQPLIWILPEPEKKEKS